MSIKYEIHSFVWAIQMLLKTRDVFFIRLMIAQFKDLKRNML